MHDPSRAGMESILDFSLFAIAPRTAIHLPLDRDQPRRTRTSGELKLLSGEHREDRSLGYSVGQVLARVARAEPPASPFAIRSGGLRVAGLAPAFPTQHFEAELAYINPAVDPARGSVEVKLRVREPPAYLLQDMTVSVDVEVARRNGVLAIPADTIRDSATAAPWVLAVRAGRTERQSVTLGARGTGLVEVLTGLGEAELVVPGSEVKMQEGARVRVQPASASGAEKT